jgi:hypothetical protein
MSDVDALREEDEVQAFAISTFVHVRLCICI